MKLTLLHKLFKSKISIDEFKSIIQSEIEQYEKHQRNRGTSVLVNVDEDYTLNFGKTDLQLLYGYYLDDRLTNFEVSYIVDCLTLSESVYFDSPEILHLLEEITDPEINGEITKEKVLLILNALS